MICQRPLLASESELLGLDALDRWHRFCSRNTLAVWASSALTSPKGDGHDGHENHSVKPLQDEDSPVGHPPSPAHKRRSRYRSGARQLDQPGERRRYAAIALKRRAAATGATMRVPSHGRSFALVMALSSSGSAKTTPSGAPASARSAGGMRFGNIDFAVRLNGNGRADVMENGAYVGGDTEYRAGDVFRVEVVAGRVRYLKNGQVMHVSQKWPTYPLVFDVALGSLGATIANARIETRESAVATSTSTMSSGGLDRNNDGLISRREWVGTRGQIQSA